MWSTLPVASKKKRAASMRSQMRYAIARCPAINAYIFVGLVNAHTHLIALGSTATDLLARLKDEMSLYELTPGGPATDKALRGLVDHLGDPSTPLEHTLSRTRGTPFQRQVWTAISRIPQGETRSYADLARDMGQPTAVRAVAQACGKNDLALLIPCHRVVASNGSLGGYRWGVEIKQRLLERERTAVKARAGAESADSSSSVVSLPPSTIVAALTS